MNSRIKYLAEAALGTRKYVPPVWQFYDIELENFVNLIIEECLICIEQDLNDNKLLSVDDAGNSWVNSQKSYLEIIKRKFGVENGNN